MLENLFDYFGGTFGFLALTVLFCAVYQFILRTWFYFSDRNVKFVRGIPLLGSTYRTLAGLESAAISYQRCYERYPNEKFIGLYDLGGKPSYLIRDPKLIKQLTTTDFDHFVNHKFTFDNENDLFAHTLFGMRDGKWRKMRATMSPAFTGSKMRLMHNLMVRCSEQFIEALKDNDKVTKMFDARDLFSRYANDIIATSAFGIEMDSMRDPENEFFKVGCSLAEFGFLDGLKFLASLSFPSLIKLLDIRITRDSNANFMQTIVRKNVQERKQRNIVRNDMIDLLIKAKAGQLHYDDADDKTNVGFATTEESMVGKSSQEIQNWTDEDMVAQCMIFFIGGFSSISTAACFMFHELALNPDIQAKLYNEIEVIRKELNGKPLQYETIPKLKYLDMVVSETLRRWCPIAFVERTCTQTHILENSHGGKVQLSVGDGIFIPTYALHMDKNYFSNPEKFDPERFNEENRVSIQAGTYLPFGIGPRNCIGSRFAIMEIKTLAYYVLSEFFIDKSARTQDPLVLKPSALTMEAEKGFFVELRRRQPDRTPYKSKIFSGI